MTCFRADHAEISTQNLNNGWILRAGSSIGRRDLWGTEFILAHDGKPSYTISIMEFSGYKVARETQYFADPFRAPAWRAQWVERMGAKG